MNIGGADWVEEISDYAYTGRKLKYYTVALKLKNRFIVAEACCPAPNFEKALPFFKDVIGSIKVVGYTPLPTPKPATDPVGN